MSNRKLFGAGFMLATMLAAFAAYSQEEFDDLEPAVDTSAPVDDMDSLEPAVDTSAEGAEADADAAAGPEFERTYSLVCHVPE